MSNGGCVAKKKYALNNTRIKGYGRPNYGVSNSTTTTENSAKSTKTAQETYYKKYNGNSTRIDEVFKAAGVPEQYRGTYVKRKPIALANGIADYQGTFQQNMALINLAKVGTLKKPNS